MSPDFTLSQYQKLIEGFYGFLALVEEPVLKLTHSLLPDSQERKKIGWLKEDLISLNLSELNLKLLPKREQVFKNKYEALGFLYVIEGSTLGGQMIVKKLKENKRLGDANFNYYSGYGPKTGKYWKTFKETTNAVLPEYHEQVLYSASQTFMHLEEWMSQRMHVT